MTGPQTRGKPYRAKNQLWLKLRFFIITLADKFPFSGRLLRYLYKKIKILSYKWKRKETITSIDANETHWLDPSKIVYASLNEFHIYEDKGKVIGGEWDHLEKRFEDLDVYVSFKERFIEGKKWQDTPYYQRMLNEIKQGVLRWRCKNEEDLRKRCATLDHLFQSIQEKGYKSHSQILSEKNIDDPIQIEDEITVNVGRNGDLLFNNAAHRLTIVKLLGLEHIPVKITVRHPQWVDFKQQILLFAQDQPSGKVYQPLTHPDLQDVPSFHDSESDRLRLIMENLGVRSGRLLDIGAHWGFFCHKFEEIGFDCYAVENDSLHQYFMEKLKRAENRHFKIISESIFEYQDIKNTNFDIVLALNIFHHFLKQKDTYTKLVDLLNNLNMKEMYFQPHNIDDLLDKEIYINYSENEFVDFILQTSKLNKAQLLGRAKDGRGIYKLY